MSTVKTNNVQVGQSATATNNFTLYQPVTPDGTVRLGVGNSGATTLDAMTVSNAGTVTATAFSGSGASLTGLNVSSVSSGTLAIANGGTGQATANAAFNALAPAQTANRLLKSDGTNTSFAQVALTTDVTGTLPVANGGTNATTLTANNVILGNGTTGVLFVAPGTSGNFLTSNGTTWTSATLTTTQVLTATAGAAVGAVGTYALLYDSAALVRNPGDTLAGATLRYTSCDGAPTTTAPAGTWRIMGATSVSTNRSSTSVWLRIS